MWDLFQSKESLKKELNSIYDMVDDLAENDEDYRNLLYNPQNNNYKPSFFERVQEALKTFCMFVGVTIVVLLCLAGIGFLIYHFAL